MKEETKDPSKDYHNPFKNPDAISIVKQADGNYIGYAQKFGKTIEVRDIGPETVLQRIITHSAE